MNRGMCNKLKNILILDEQGFKDIHFGGKEDGRLYYIPPLQSCDVL
jgi:hypothetical protein